MDLCRKALRLELRHRGLALHPHSSRVSSCTNGRNVIKKQLLLKLLPNGSWEGFASQIYVIDTRVVNALLRPLENGLFDSTGRIKVRGVRAVALDRERSRHTLLWHVASGECFRQFRVRSLPTFGR